VEEGSVDELSGVMSSLRRDLEYGTAFAAALYLTSTESGATSK